MFKKKECVAMLLAGGQGSRLYALTQQVAKPAVPFGGKYRIIDFPLSNCTNSGIDTVGVLTQYQPLVLNDYIGNGLPWDLDRAFGGIKILPPIRGSIPGTGTRAPPTPSIKICASSINLIRNTYWYYRETIFIKWTILKCFGFHKNRAADCTIAVIDVPIEEASRFGIMTIDWEQRITNFAEKPREPESTKASMGIYIFNRKKLYEYLIADAKDPASDNDFGKNIIPAMLAAGEKMYGLPV